MYSLMNLPVEPNSMYLMKYIYRLHGITDLKCLNESLQVSCSED
jgi:hypothetical protein